MIQQSEVVTLVLGVAALVFVRLYYSQIGKLPCACVVVAALCVSVVEERERRRLGGILHDKVSQLLVIAKMKLEAIRQRIADGCVGMGLDEVGDSLGRAIGDALTLTFDVSYPILYELGFEAAVAEWLADEVEGEHGIATEFEDDGQSKPMDDDVRAVLFRDVRELLFNVVRHSRVNKVKVSVGL